MKDESNDLKLAATIIGGIALGALAMYLSDPVKGRRRRAMAQDKVRSMTNRTGDTLGRVMRDAGSRLTGLQAQASRLVNQRNYKPLDNHVLEARVKSKLGRFVSNAHQLDVIADEGCVTLRGPVLADERQHLLKMVAGIPGVEDVRDRLDAYDDEAHLAQAADRHVQEGNWSGAEIMALLGGGLLGYYGIARRSPAGVALAVAGMGLAVRNMGVSGNLAGLGALLGNMGGIDWKKLLGGAIQSEPIRVQKTIQIKANPETVFEVWSRYENFPHFMSNVIEVRDLGKQRSHWVVRGPAGSNVEWDSVLTRFDRPHALAWQSEPGATVQNEGLVQLEADGRGGTRATISMTYQLPAGMVGQGIAMLMGADPQRQLEEDLARMKQFIERGAPLQDTTQPATTSGQVLH